MTKPDEPAGFALEHNEAGYGDSIQLYIGDTRNSIPFTKGLTKREYFAALALQGLIAHPSVVGDFEGLSKYAVKYADALIKALNETNA